MPGRCLVPEPPRTSALQRRNTPWMTSKECMRGGSSGRGRVSPALTGDQILSLSEARTEQPSAWILSTSPTRSCVAGGLEFGAGSIHGSISVRGHRPAPGVRLVRASPIQACCLHAWCLACVDFASSGGRAPYFVYFFIYLFIFYFGGRKLTCPSMPIISATRKTDKANHWRVSGPQHIL